VPRRAAAPAPKAWTVMVYLCGDNNLESSAVADLREMKSVGTTAELNVVAQFDRYHKGMPTRRYLLRRGTSLRSDAVGPALGETNTGDPQVLIDFATWAIDNYPAKHYLLVVWNHGQGWDDTDLYRRAAAMNLTVTRAATPLASPRVKPAAVDRKPKRAGNGGTVSAGALSAVRARGARALFASTIDSLIKTAAIGLDDHQRNFLDNKELKHAFLTITKTIGRPIDIVGLDACLMSMVEVLYEIRDGARHVVASEETIPLQGWHYRRILGAIANQPSIKPASLASRIVDDFVASYRDTRRVNLAATDMAHIAPLRGLVDALGRELLACCGDDTKRATIARARRSAWRSADTPEYVDLVDFCRAVSRASASNAALVKACDDVVTAVCNDRLVRRVKSRGRARPTPKGVTIWLPEERPLAETMGLYRNLELVRRTGWARFVDRFSARG